MRVGTVNTLLVLAITAYIIVIILSWLGIDKFSWRSPIVVNVVLPLPPLHDRLLTSTYSLCPRAKAPVGRGWHLDNLDNGS